MTIEKFQQKIKDVLSDDKAFDLHVSSDFQCEHTFGFPASICVCRELEKAMFQPNQFMQA